MFEDDRGILFILSGPSGVGKGTVREKLFEEEPQLKYSVSATTRDMRPGEIHGSDYFFKKHIEFEVMIENEELLEHAKFVDNYYGTSIDYVVVEYEAGID